MENIVAALVNFLPVPFDTAVNLASMESFAAEASAGGADIICFPELCTTGYVLPEITDSAEPADGATVKRIRDISKNHSICVSAGFAESDGNRKYITHILTEKGEVVGRYRKTHLGHNERNYFDAGDAIPVFDTSFGKVGICLCWESRFPEIQRVLSIKGAEIILVPYASGPGGNNRKEIWNRYLPTRASDDTVYVLACNMLRRETAGIAGGGVLALDFKGRVLAEDYSAEEKITFAELDAAKLAKAREGGTMGNNYYIMERRPELYGDLTVRRKTK